MKKILFISNEGTITGAPVFLVKLVQHLRTEPKYELMVFFTRGGPLADALKCEGINVYTSDKNRVDFSLIKTITKRLAHYFFYIKILLNYRPDLVYSNTLANSGEVVLAGLMRIPVLLHIHEGRSVAKGRQLRLRASCFFANQIIVGSKYANEVLKSLTGKIGVVIYNGVATPSDYLSKKAKIRRPVVMGLLGTIHENKGQIVAIKAARKLAEHGVEAILLIAGVSGNHTYFQKVRDYVEINALSNLVRFVGVVPNAGDFLNTLDLLLVPSFDETLPTVILEAFSAGVPVIASNVGGIPELIRNGENGLLVPAGNSVALANCIESIVNDIELQKNISNAAFLAVKMKFNLKVNSDQITRQLDAILLPLRQ